MKKIILITIAALTALLSSCNMDLFPYNAIEESQGMQTVEDATNYRVSIYNPLKSITVGGRLYIEDLRADMFHALADFGNMYGQFYNWNLITTDTDVESVWYGDYSCVAIANYAIDRFGKIRNKLTANEDIAMMDLYIAEAHMLRAMAYLDLALKFCEIYDPSNADQQMGLPLSTDYNPTSDSSVYPGRSSLAETYELILSDLDDAATITTVGAANSRYFTEDAVTALRARVLLYMQEYEEALECAESLITSSKYSLCDASNYRAMWENDESPENIMLVAMSQHDLGASMGGSYYINSKNIDGSNPDPTFIPTKKLIDLYEEDDIRFTMNFRQETISVAGRGEAEVWLFNKFPSNLSLCSGVPNYIHMGKPFRIAEQYLIAIECCAQLGYAQDGSDHLKVLRTSRGASSNDSYTAEALMEEVKIERARELVGEGFRMVDLRRWNDGNVVRGEAQNDDAYALLMKGSGKDYEALDKPLADHCVIWPIPKTEMDANPQLKNQQNPGY